MPSQTSEPAHRLGSRALACVRCNQQQRNLFPRAHVSFGQHQDTELWNNHLPEFKILGLPVSRHKCVWLKTWLPEIKSMWMCIESLYGTNSYRFYLWMPCFKPKHACARKPKVLKSWTLKIDYSRAPCLGADQKTVGSGDKIDSKGRT